MTELETTLIAVLENVKDYLDADVRPTCGGADCECIIHDVDHAFAEIERLSHSPTPTEEVCSWCGAPATQDRRIQLADGGGSVRVCDDCALKAEQPL